MSEGLSFLYGSTSNILNYIKKKEFEQDKIKIVTKIVQRVDHNTLYFVCTYKYIINHYLEEYVASLLKIVWFATRYGTIYFIES